MIRRMSWDSQEVSDSDQPSTFFPELLSSCSLRVVLRVTMVDVIWQQRWCWRMIRLFNGYISYTHIERLLITVTVYNDTSSYYSILCFDNVSPLETTTKSRYVPRIPSPHDHHRHPKPSQLIDVTVP